MIPRPLLAVIVAAAIAASGCSPGNTEGGGTRPEFYWVIVNNSDEPIFTVFQRPDENGVFAPTDLDQPTGNFSVTVPTGETVRFQQGTAAMGDNTPGGCFSGGAGWVVRSRSGRTEFPSRAPIDEFVADLEALTHVDSSTCTTEEEVVWEYNGPQQGKTRPDVADMSDASARRRLPSKVSHLARQIVRLDVSTPSRIFQPGLSHMAGAIRPLSNASA